MTAPKTPKLTLLEKNKASLTKKVHSNFSKALSDVVEVVGIQGARDLIEAADGELGRALEDGANKKT